MPKPIPQIRIQYSWLLAGETAAIMNDTYGDGTPLRSFEEYEKTALRYREWWDPYNDKILHGLCDILDLKFRQNIIDIYISPWFNPISDPMVIGPAFKTEDALVNTITHELIHRLLTDNLSTPYEYDLLADWTKLFGKTHEWNTLVHIPVHAVMKKLYLDVIDRPDLLAYDIEDVKDNTPYANAWKYVNEENYLDIIEGITISKIS